MEVQFGGQEVAVRLYTATNVILQESPHFPNLQDHFLVALRVPNRTVVALPHDLVQEVEELPGCEPALHQWLAGGHHPEALGLLGLVNHDDYGSGMFRFEWCLQAIQSFIYTYVLKWKTAKR